MIAKRPPVLLLAVVTGGVVANTYYCQPLLDRMAAGLGVWQGWAVLISGATQLGYALGMLLLAPLGDLASRRRIILGQFVLLVPALLLVAASPDLGALLAGSLGVGFAATIVQQIIPLSAALVAPEATGRAVGTVMTGLTLGILLSRPVAGFLDDLLGWRLVFVAAAGLTLVLGVLAWRIVPETRPRSRASYGALLASLPGLLSTQPALRRAAMSGCYGRLRSTRSGRCWRFICRGRRSGSGRVRSGCSGWRRPGGRSSRGRRGGWRTGAGRGW